MRHLLMKAGVVLAIAMMVACRQAATPMKEEPPPEPTAEELLRGTWVRFHDEYDSNELVGHTTRLMTFTKSRFVEHNVRTDLEGAVVRDWTKEGSWSADDDAIMKTEMYYDGDEGKIRTIRKGYLLDGDRLFVHLWLRGNPENSYDRYMRVEYMLTLEDLIGVWKSRTSSYVDRATGCEGTTEVTYTISPGRFAEMEVWEEDCAGVPREGSFLMSGTMTIDPDELFLMLTIEEGVSVINGEENTEDLLREQVGTTVRYAFAPGALPDSDSMVVSDSGQEQTWDPDTMSWKEGREGRPWGRYFRVMTKQ